MYRDIMNDLVRWKDSRRRKPLLLTGVRQCGKTYIVKEFGRQYFDDFVYINFEENEKLAAIFEYDLDVERIVKELEVTLRARITIGHTLVFFDEIQAVPKAITSLKYFCENMKELHLICAGSLLGVALKHENISFPVGKVNRMQLYPLNFKEFVIAAGGENMLEMLSNWPADREIPEIYSHPMRNYLRDYYIVGGMPEAVAEWVERHDYDEVEAIQREILQDYADDFAKHAPIPEVPNIHLVWDSIPVQLARENNKFVFSHVKQGKRAKDLENALQWIIDAGLAYKLPLISNVEVPLSSFADGTYFKLYLADVGLLRVRSNIDYRTILAGNSDFREYKGAMAENYVLTELITQGISPYFWRSGNTAELDFVYEKHNRIIPVEVKSADNVQAKSYRLFCNRYTPETGFKLSMKNIGNNICGSTSTYNLPLYLVWNMKQYEQ